jgi:hypothetical protein
LQAVAAAVEFMVVVVALVAIVHLLEQVVVAHRQKQNLVLHLALHTR